MCEIISKLTIKAAERHQGGHCCAFILVFFMCLYTHRSVASIVDSEQVIAGCYMTFPKDKVFI